MSGNGNAISYAFRGAISVVGILLAIVGWFMINTLSDVKESIAKNSSTQWQSISKLTDVTNALDKQLGTLSQTLSDSIRSNSDAVNRLSSEEQDHESRIRTLEHPH